MSEEQLISRNVSRKSYNSSVAYDLRTLTSNVLDPLSGGSFFFHILRLEVFTSLVYAPFCLTKKKNGDVYVMGKTRSRTCGLKKREVVKLYFLAIFLVDRMIVINREHYCSTVPSNFPRLCYWYPEGWTTN